MPPCSDPTGPDHSAGPDHPAGPRDTTGPRPVVRAVDTAHGPARLTVYLAARPVGVLLVGHGAGGGIEAPDLVALATELPTRGITVVLAEQPWRVAGKRVAPAPRTLDAGWLPCAADVSAHEARQLPLAVGGRSAGARVACRTAGSCGAVAVVALAFPLHPPGRPERSRVEELLGVDVPGVLVQGESDAFGTPAEFPNLADGWTVTPLPAAGHAFTVPARASVTRAQVLSLLTGAVGDRLQAVFTGQAPHR